MCVREMIADDVPAAWCDDYFERRNLLESCLEIGYRRGGMTKDRCSRLAGRDSVRLIGSLNELRVAVWFESQGFTVAFDPPARSGRRGDLLVRVGDNEVFVEVKTVFGDADLLCRDEFLGILADLFESEGIPVRTVELVQLPSRITKERQEHVAADMLDYVRSRLPPGSTWKFRRLVYRKLGVEAVVTLSPKDEAVRALSHGGFMSIEDGLRHKVGMEVGDMPGRRQLAICPIPSIVVICDQASVVDAALTGLLYGTHVVHMGSVSGPSEWSERRSDGLWCGGRCDPLSAVGLVETQLDVSPRSFDLCLNPTPEFPLSQPVLERMNVNIWDLGPDGIDVPKIR